MFIVKKLRASVFGLYGNMNFTKSAFSEHAKNFNPEDMQVQMEEKNCIVTGANSGIGFATAEGLASRGATAYMVCRNKERGEAALTKIHSNTGNKNVYLEVCDISSVNDVKSFTSRFCSKDVPVHVLVNNAGLLEANRVITPEGYEGKLRSSEEGADTVIWLALQPKEKLVPGAFYFDRAEAPKHLPLTGTKNSHSAIDSIVEKLGSFAGL